MLFKAPHVNYHWVCEVSGYEFNAPFIDLFYSEYILNRIFAIRGYATLNDLFEIGSLIDNRASKYDEIGWSLNDHEETGTPWIDFSHDFDQKTGIFTIRYPFEPHYLYDWFGMNKPEGVYA